MAGRVVGAEVVDRVDQAGAEEEGPDPVGRGPGEVGIVASDDPVGQDSPGRRLRPPGGLGVVEKPRGDHLRAAGDRQLATIGDLAPLEYLAVLLLRPLDPGEERGQGPELFALPRGERMVVALGALDPEAQESPRRAGGEVLRLGVVRRVERQRRWPDLLAVGQRAGGPSFAERGRQDLADHCVVWGPFGELAAEPGVQAGGEVLEREVVFEVGQEQPSPDVGEVVRVARPCQVPFDQGSPLAGGRVVEERAGFGGG